MIEQFASEAEAHPEVVAMHYTEAGNFDRRRAGGRGPASMRSSARRTRRPSPTTRRVSLRWSAAGVGGRDQLELALQVELGYALIPVKGWAAPETAQAFTRAGELCRRIGDTPKLFRALWGLGAFHFVRGDQHGAASRRPMPRRRAPADDVDALIEAHYLSGIVSCVMGDFVSGRRTWRSASVSTAPTSATSSPLRPGREGVGAGLAGDGAVGLGHPDAALGARTRVARARARSAAAVPARTRSGRRSDSCTCSAASRKARTRRCSRRSPCAPSRASATFTQSCPRSRAPISSCSAAPIEGIAQMQASISALRTIGSELLLTVVLGHVASAHCALLQTDQGLAAIEDGLGCVGRNSEHWGEAELHRIRGHLLLTRGAHHAEDAEASYRTALEVAARQRARAYQLRAATSLAELWRGQGKSERADILLTDVVGTWPDELASPGLDSARKAMQRLDFVRADPRDKPQNSVHRMYPTDRRGMGISMRRLLRFAPAACRNAGCAALAAGLRSGWRYSSRARRCLRRMGNRFRARVCRRAIRSTTSGCRQAIGTTTTSTAPNGEERLAEQFYTLNATQRILFPIDSPNPSRVLLDLKVGGDLTRSFPKLGRVFGEIQPSFQYRKSADFYSPTVVVFAFRMGADHFGSSPARSSRYSAEVSICSPSRTG